MADDINKESPEKKIADSSILRADEITEECNEKEA